MNYLSFKSDKFSRRSFFGKALLGLPLVLGAGHSLFAFSPAANLSGRKQAAGEQELELLRKLLSRKDPLKWVFTGDSITQGAKHTDGFRSYQEVFSERIRWEMGRPRDFVLNTAISGHTSKQVLEDYDWRIGQFKPQVVSLMIGTNDAAKQQVTPASFEANLQSLVTRIRQEGAIPLLHTPNIIITEKAGERKTLPEYVALIRKVAQKQSVVLVDHWQHWQERLEKNPEEDIYHKWLKDPLHPNGQGHLEMARLTFKALSIFDPKSFTCSGKINS
jgi:acyl-CoA thioesterase I